jgi:hypothetical protein
MVKDMKKWLKENIFVKDMFIYILIAALIFYIPVWLLSAFGIVTSNEWYYGGAAAYILFWAGPFTPTIPIIFAIAVFLKQVVKKIKGTNEEE